MPERSRTRAGSVRKRRAQRALREFEARQEQATKMARKAIGLNGQPDEDEDEDLYPRKIWTHKALMDEPDEFKWLVKGVYADCTWGPTGGLAKALKSYVSSIFDISVASGVPAFDTFEVPGPRPVRTHIGEGGKNPHKRRTRRLCDRMGISEKDIPLYTQFEIARIGSDQFTYWLIEDLFLYEPGRTSIDPLYIYHADVTSSDLYSRGPMLAGLSSLCTQHGSALNLVDHFKKTGKGSSLDQMSQAGMSEWADTWVLLTHRRKPDVPKGDFKLLMEIGSRQWGGALYHLDLSLGTFDTEAGEFLGDIDWKLAPAESHGGGEGRSVSKNSAYLERKILKALAAEPYVYSKSAAYEEIGGKKATFDEVWETLEEDGSIHQKPDGGVRAPWAVSFDYTPPEEDDDE